MDTYNQKYIYTVQTLNADSSEYFMEDLLRYSCLLMAVTAYTIFFVVKYMLQNVYIHFISKYKKQNDLPHI